MDISIRNDIKEFTEDLVKANGESARKAYEAELKRFLCFVLTSNSSISDGEPEFLSDFLGRKISAEEMANYVAAENIHSREFATKIPELFKKNINDAALTGCYLSMLARLGKEAVISDQKADAEEVDALTDYIDMLSSYYTEENPDSPIEFTNEISKEFGFTNENSKNTPEDTATLEELLEELDGLIGLTSVKKNVHSLLHLQSIQMEREKRGLPKIVMSNHLIFTGNPGTGKTTVARLIARIYNKIGLLSTGNFVEVDRYGMVAGYVGQTAIEVKNVMDSAKGGVLFIDEAYSLANGLQGDYGMEAIETLLKRMEDDRSDMIVIAAGYPELMERFLASNPGLRSRFSKKIVFPDYTPDELLDIFKFMLKNQKFTATEEAIDFVYKSLEKKYENRDDNFANAREVRNLFEAAIVSQADRLYGKENLSDDELCRLEIDDFQYNEIMIE